MPDGKGVLVLGEALGGQLSLTAQELLAAGRQVADTLGEELAIGLLSDTVEGASQQAVSYGADQVYTVTSPLLGQYQVDLYLAAMETLSREVDPNIILIGRTIEGRGAGPSAGFSPWRGAGPGLSRGLGGPGHQKAAGQPSGLRRQRRGGDQLQLQSPNRRSPAQSI